MRACAFRPACGRPLRRCCSRRCSSPPPRRCRPPPPPSARTPPPPPGRLAVHEAARPAAALRGGRHARPDRDLHLVRQRRHRHRRLCRHLPHHGAAPARPCGGVAAVRLCGGVAAARLCGGVAARLWGCGAVHGCRTTGRCAAWGPPRGLRRRCRPAGRPPQARASPLLPPIQCSAHADRWHHRHAAHPQPCFAPGPFTACMSTYLCACRSPTSSTRRAAWAPRPS